MHTLLHARRLVAALCLAVLLFSALTQSPGGASGLLYAILVPLWVFLAAIVIVSIRRAAEHCEAQQSACFSIVSSRAPPIG